MPDIRRRELASAAQLDTIILALTQARRGEVKAAYGRQDVRVWIVGNRLRPVPFDAYPAAELAEAYAWMLRDERPPMAWAVRDDPAGWKPGGEVMPLAGV